MKQIKQTYLILLIVISLFSLAIYSTYAMFTTEINTNDIVSIDTTISIDTNIDEYQIVTINSNDYKILKLSINNTEENDLYYGVWYELMSESDYNISAYKLNTSLSATVDIIKSSSQKQVSIALINNTNKKAIIKLGVVTSQNSSLNLPEIRKLITEEIANTDVKNQTAAEYLKYKYANDSMELYYDDNNLIYYGKNPNNYLILNNELWRILGIYNNQLKIIKSESIGNYIYDNKNNNLKNSKINVLLNDLYYNSKKGNCYQTKALQECDFTKTGITKDTIDKISTQKINEEIISIATNEKAYITPVMTETIFEDNITLLSLTDYKKTLNCKESNCEDSWLLEKDTLLSTKNIIDNNNTNAISINKGTIKIDNQLSDSLEIRPVILLKENIYIIKGNGSKNDPYILK